MPDMQITHFYRARLGENAEDYYNYSETAYKIGSKCPYLWKVVSQALNHKRSKRIHRSKRSITGLAAYVYYGPNAVGIRSNVVQVTKLEKGRLTKAGLSVLIYGRTFFDRIIFFCSPLIITSTLFIFNSDSPLAEIENVQCSKLPKSGSEKCPQMYYLLRRPLVIAVKTAIRA